MKLHGLFMPDFEFNLPYPPTVNHYHQPVRQGRGVRIIKLAKARAYQVEAVAALVAAGLDGVAIHSGRKEFERLYGSEIELLELTRSLIDG